MLIMNSFLADVLDRIALQAGKLCTLNKKDRHPGHYTRARSAAREKYKRRSSWSFKANWLNTTLSLKEPKQLLSSLQDISSVQSSGWWYESFPLFFSIVHVWVVLGVYIDIISDDMCLFLYTWIYLWYVYPVNSYLLFIYTESNIKQNDI